MLKVIDTKISIGILKDYHIRIEWYYVIIERYYDFMIVWCYDNVM